jgi:cysteine desulfurase / selenocysteine lyase
MNTIESLVLDEAARRENFPVCKKQIFFAHAGVTVLPRVVGDAMTNYIRASCENHQEFGGVLRDVDATRSAAAQLIGAHPGEIALLGPTALGLSLVANGLPWRDGDELLCYRDDYPSNVYPWMELERRGVRVRYIETERQGEITPEHVERTLTPRTRLVALASCNFVSGFRIDVDAIGKLIRTRNILFCLDAIQTLGAFPVSVEHVDFLSADTHKWLLGPMAAGIVFVKKERFELLRPTLLGAWNVRSPRFVTQDTITFPDTAMRYEPGALNIAGIVGMKAAIDLLAGIGIDRVSARLHDLKKQTVTSLDPLGFEIYGPRDGANASGITTFRHPRANMRELFRRLEENNIVTSLRFNRAGDEFIRFSPHFYNTSEEIARAVEVLRGGL